MTYVQTHAKSPPSHQKWSNRFQFLLFRANCRNL